MPNPNPRIENLTRAGMGRPPLGKERKQVTLPPYLVAAVNLLCEQQDWTFSYTLEQILCHSLGLPHDYEGDMALILKGAPIE
jgi:hypothetical protein